MATATMLTGSLAALSMSCKDVSSVNRFSNSSVFCPCATPLRSEKLSLPLRIDARVPTRREKVKVRHRRLRKKLNGTTERPRLSVFRSNKHLYAQVIDDTKQHTLASASTLTKSMREELELSSGPTVDAARRVGQEIAKVCAEKGITKVSFDREVSFTMAVSRLSPKEQGKVV